MKTESNLELPKTDGLILVRGRWYFSYYAKGRRVRVSTGTGDAGAAKEFSEQFKQKALAAGATIRASHPTLEKVKRNPHMYIYQRKPFLIKIEGHTVGEADTVEEAFSIRDSYLQKKCSLNG